MSAVTAGRTAPSRKEITHERIVGAAARAIRRSGYDGTGVADIMKKVGLTHGGFYAHFASREAMLAEAADRAGAESVATLTRVAADATPLAPKVPFLHQNMMSIIWRRTTLLEANMSTRQQSHPGSSIAWRNAPTKVVDVGGTKLVYRQLGPDTGVPVIFLNHLAAELDR